MIYMMKLIIVFIDDLPKSLVVVRRIDKNTRIS